jgi:lipopolysaccharide assembly outer membrane protein LptD (OstA)
VNYCLFILLLFNLESSSTISYSGERIFFNVDSNLVRIFGKAEAKYGKLSVSADTILYNLDRKILTAKGDVVFNDGSSDIRAEKMIYDVDREIGDAFNAKTQAEKGWFFGKKVRYFKGNVLRIKNGYYTTCELDPPHFWFYSPKMRINIDDNLVAEPVFLLVQDIPVFFVPFYFQSIKKKRSSGLLSPEFGTSSYGGNHIRKLGWYQTLGDHADISFYMNYYTRTGVRFDVNQLRWNLMPYSQGDLSGNYIEERESGEERWSLLINTQSKIPGGINLNVDTEIRSDPDFLMDYEPGEVERLLRKEINYNFNWNGEILGARTNIIMDHRENLVTEQLRKRWPYVNMTFPMWKAGAFNLRSFYKFNRDETGHWATGFSGNSNFNFNLAVFNIDLALNGQGDYYENEDVFIDYWKTVARIKTNLYGLSLFGIPPVTKFRHVITPSVSFSYAPDPGSYDISDISGFSVPRAVKSLNLYLDNLFQCKIGDRKFDFASLRFSSNYLYEEDRFSPVSIYGRVWIGDIFRQDYSTTYDLDSREFGDKRVNTDLKYMSSFGGNPLGFYLRHSINFTETDRIQQADFGVEVNPTPKWKLRLRTHYDFERGEITNTSVDLVRDLHCWELTLAVNTFGNSWDYSMKIGLKAIPELQIGRETLGGFMP